ncbi:MAG: ABC transporter ATP-binding protein [Bacilli bacterium]
MKTLRITNLNVSYDDKKIINDLNVTFTNKAFTFILGPNGSGKTTLLKAIALLIKSSGDISFNNIELNKIKPVQRAQKIAYFSQMAMVNLDFSVYDTIMMGRFPYLESSFSSYQTIDHQLVMQVIEEFDLIPIQKQKLANLSGGQLQRVLIARLIVQDPDVILVDEMTNFLDFKYQVYVIEYLIKWAQTHDKILVAIVHDLNLALMYGQEIIVLDEGYIKLQGDVRSVFKSALINDIFDLNISEWYYNLSAKWRSLHE